jgi:hypothetical protein
VPHPGLRTHPGRLPPHRLASRNGRTDVVNGACVCDRHHTLIHKGALFVAGNADGTLTVKNRDGTLVGFSAPPTALPRL